MRAGKHCGNMQRVFSQNPTPRCSTPHFSILARSFAQLENQNAMCVRLKRFAAQKIRLHSP
jgi:hypothetical protein